MKTSLEILVKVLSHPATPGFRNTFPDYLHTSLQNIDHLPLHLCPWLSP